MARGGSGMGTIIGLGAAGFGVWWLGNQYGWWNSFFGGSTTIAATPPVASGIVPASTPMPTTSTPAATVTMNGTPAATINNALKASFTINGQTLNIAVIQNGDAFNDAGQDITSNLTAMGVSASQLYGLMSAAYKAPIPTTNQKATVTTGRGGATATSKRAALADLLSSFQGFLFQYTSAPAFIQPSMKAALVGLAAQIKAAGGTVPTNSLGLSGYMPMATRHNYLRRVH